MKPYIGVCDVATAEQARRLVELVPHGFSHDVMIGVMMSRKTLYDIPSKWTDIFPKKETIKNIFIDDPRVMNTIHYADYAVGNDADVNLAYTLGRVADFGGPNLDAIQLDMIWPNPGDLKIFRGAVRTLLHTYGGARKDIPIVLQVGENAMEECGNDPFVVRDRLLEYGDSIDAVLFDKSMGEGKGLNAELLAQYIGVLVADCPHLLPAVGGGLGPTSTDLVEDLLSAYPHLSWDAQSKLRPSGNKKDPLDVHFASHYVKKSVSLVELMRGRIANDDEQG